MSDILDIEIPDRYRAAIFPAFPRLLGRFAEHGLTVEVTHDFPELVRVNDAAQAAGSWDQLFPPADHRCSDLTPDNAFLLLARNRAGEVVITLLQRVWNTGNLARDIRTMDLFYSYIDPCSIESCTVPPSTLADTTAGKIALVTGGWVRPDWRGKGLFGQMLRLGKAVSLCRWSPDWWVGLAEPYSLASIRYAGTEVDVDGKIIWCRMTSQSDPARGTEPVELRLIRARQDDIIPELLL